MLHSPPYMAYDRPKPPILSMQPAVCPTISFFEAMYKETRHYTRVCIPEASVTPASQTHALVRLIRKWRRLHLSNRRPVFRFFTKSRICVFSTESSNIIDWGRCIPIVALRCQFLRCSESAQTLPFRHVLLGISSTGPSILL